MTLDELIDAWRINDSLNFELLDICVDDDLDLKPGKGKTIRSNFVHIIGVRAAWIKERLRKEAEAVPRLDWQTATITQIREGLTISGELMKDTLRKQDETGRPARWTTPMFFGYCVAHEANHRAQIEVALRLNGREPDKDFLYGMWNWPKK